MHTVRETSSLTLPFISSLRYQADRLVEPNFSAVVDGAPFALKGRNKAILKAISKAN